MDAVSKALPYLLLNGRWIGTERGRPPALLGENNTYLVSAREMASEMGGQGEWDPGSATVTVGFNGKTAKFTVGSLLGDTDGGRVDLPAPPEMVKEEAYVPAAVLAQFLGAATAPAQGLKDQVLIWTRTEKVWNGIPMMLDPGHGGKDPGASGPAGTNEKDINLRITLGLRQILALAGAKPLMTRTADRFVSLANRAAMANTAKAKLFVAVHSNWITDPMVTGTETYYYHTAMGQALAHAIQTEMISELGWISRGVKEANFYVLRHTTMAASLCEVGFLSNKEEEQELTNPFVDYRASAAIYRGIRNFMEGSSGNY